MKNNRSWKIIVALLLVFLAGGLAGSALTAHLIGRALKRSLQFENWAAHTEEKLTAKLSLTAEQRSQTHSIIQEMGKDFHSIFSRTFRESGELIVRSGRRIDALLTPEQQRIHAEMKAELRQRLRKDLQFELPPE